MTGLKQIPTEQTAALVDEKGPWPFVTRRVFRLEDKSVQTWRSRHHRKNLHTHLPAEEESPQSKLLRCLWMPRQLNWWIGVVFALGALLFALASVLSLIPTLARAWSVDTTVINAIFFTGSIPFTIAAYLQLYQAANAGDFPHDVTRSESSSTLLGWQPHNIGWLSCALQFVGTVFFNFNTFDAMIPSLTWFQQDLVVWAPNIIGSILFLVSGYLAFIETCHAHWAWNPTSISWWVVAINLMGCVCFMLSALFAIVLPGPTNIEAVTFAVVFTLLGAICFLFGSLLMLPEAILASEKC